MLSSRYSDRLDFPETTTTHRMWDDFPEPMLFLAHCLEDFQGAPMRGSQEDVSEINEVGRREREKGERRKGEGTGEGEARGR